jgi:hypothetical protein
MHFFKAVAGVIAVLALAACTPAFTQQKGSQFAAQARLRDSVDIQRGNQRLLSRQVQVCLVSDASGTAAGASLLRAMQAGFNGYFLAVGVESEPMDYLRAVAVRPCPAADYLFFVQPIGRAVCIRDDQQCSYPSLQYTVTVVSSGDHSLVDRINLAIKSSFLPNETDDAARLQNGFEQLAIALTGAER